MPKRDVKSSKLDLKAFQEILERTTDMLEQRLVGRLTAIMATKEELAEFRTQVQQNFNGLQQNFDGLQQNFNSLQQNFDGLKDLIVNRYMEIHKKTHQKIEDRLQKVETAVFR